MWNSTHGYICCWYKGKRTYEHIKVMEEHLQQELPIGSIIHHIDGDGTNNDISNLYLCKNRAEHKELHRVLRNIKAGVPINKVYCSFCKMWKDRSEMVANRLSGHCKVCHAIKNRGRKRDYKSEWIKYKERRQRLLSSS